MARKKSSLGGRMVLTLFMLLLLCIGSGMLLSASREFMESLEALSWPTAVGKVTRSELKTETQKFRTRSSDGIRRSATEDIFTPMIDYTFEVDGKEFQGTRLTSVRGGTLGDRASVEERLRKYPIGKSVTVSYNPIDPEQCLLEPGSWGGFLLLFALSLFLIVFSCAMLFVAWSPKYSHIISGL
ncbi:MAG: DUF3592 domain-containing protein [Pirellula sp.]